MDNTNMENNTPGNKSGDDAKLVVCVRGKEPQQVRMDADGMVLGRAGGPDLAVAAESSLLAALHGKFTRAKNSYEYEDCSGLSNTWYNGQLLGSEEMDRQRRVLLSDGDILRVDQPENGESHAEAVVFIFRKRYDDKTEWRTLGLDSGRSKLFISRSEELAEGRTEVSEDLAELPGRYGTLVKEGGTWYVEDHNTRFGIRVNQQKIEGRRALRALDVILIGNTLFLYQHDTVFYNHRETSKNNLVIHIEERSVWNLFRKHVLLEDINLTIHPGEMVLILGGSGAGKTTFINAVMGYEKAKGRIMEGDIDIYRNYNQMKYEIGFVPQQDLLRLEDNVYQTLSNAAELKMPKTTTEAERDARINAVLEMLGLERERDSLVSKLSGGQRKRLSIAVEFIADPSLFFLDEPDSGLDGVMARALMENLRDIADQNKIVLVITHSPDRADDLFDKVIVLAKSAEDNVGHMAFYGSIREAKDFFEADTMEDIVRRVNRDDEGGEGLADVYIKKYREIEEAGQ